MPTNPAAVAVFTTLLTGEPVSRAEIARSTGLSGAAVTKVVRPLLAAGYVVEQSARGNGELGRPGSPLTLRADREYFVGVKATADELIGVVVDLRARVREVAHRPLASTAVDAVVAEIGALVDELRGRAAGYRTRCHSIGVAVAGDVDRAHGTVRYSPFLDWRDVPLAELVGAATGLRTVVENDVKALATAEWWFGAGAGVDSFALVTVGTGIGCALVIDGGLVAGAFGVAGELGHLPVAGADVACRCGGRGCVEAVASERAIVAQVRAATGRRRLMMAGAVRLARQGDRDARAVFDRAGQAIGLALASVANLAGPARIVVSGEGLGAYDLFEERLREAFAEQAFEDAGRCEVVLRPLPFEEWARGAAAVSVQSLFGRR